MIGLNERMVKKARVVNHFAFETWDQTNVKGNEKTDPEYCQHFLTEAVILFIYVCVCVCLYAFCCQNIGCNIYLNCYCLGRSVDISVIEFGYSIMMVLIGI